MIMNKRQENLLKKLIVQDKYMPMKYFSDMFNISSKTISKDLDEIEQIINPIGVKMYRKQGLGIKLCYTSSQLDKLSSILNNIKVSDGDDVLEHRRIKILLKLLINTNKYTTIQKLSDEYIVSRTSINNDLNEIQHKLDKYNLKLSKTLKGTRIVGSEINIRKALVSIIQEYGKINPSYITEYQNIRHRELKINEFNTLLNEGAISFFENLLNKLESKLNLVVYEPYYTNLLTHLMIMTNRIINGNYIDDNSDLNDAVLVMNKELYNSAIYLIQEIEKKFGIKINAGEVGYICKYLISIGLSYDDDEKRAKEQDLPPVYFTKDLIDTVSQISGIDYNLRVSLYERLLLHVKPMLNRMKYNIQIKNHLLKDFLREFEEKFIVIKIACFLVCSRFEINMINDHEVAYILSYFISEDEKITGSVEVKALVICHSGYGTSQLLATRLEKTFNNIKVVDVIASKSINNIDLDKIDLIVSTVNLDIERPYLIVSAFLNKIDKENIKNYMELILKSKRRFFLEDQMKTISLETVDNYKEIEQFKKYLIEDNLIHIKDNIYVYLESDTENAVREYVYEQDDVWKHVFTINYSNYRYLSKALRKIIREWLNDGK